MTTRDSGAKRPGRPKTSKQKVHTTLTLSPEAREIADKLSKAMGMSLSGFIDMQLKQLSAMVEQSDLQDKPLRDWTLDEFGKFCGLFVDEIEKEEKNK
jgi:uncharacterized protein YbaP (TraB family)